MKKENNKDMEEQQKVNCSDNFIYISGINKTYDGTRYVLNDLCFSLNHGEIAIVMGPSGSGKSTFLNILGLLDTASSGVYYFDGINLSEKSSKKTFCNVRGEKIGFIFQSYYLIDSLTVKENIIRQFRMI